MPQVRIQATRPFALGLLLALTLAMAPVLADTGRDGLVVELPFELGPRGHILVPVSVNGQAPATFAVDTGAGMNVINARYATSLGGALPAGEAIQVAGAHANTEAKMTRFDQLEMGTLTAREAPALIMDLSHVEGPDMQLDGLIGAPLLRNYDVVFDFAASRLALYEVGTLADIGQARPHTVAPIEPGPGHGQVILLGVSFQDQPMLAVLDTGSGRSGINSPAATALGIDVPAGMAAAHQGGATMHAPRAALPSMEIELGDGRLASSTPVAIIDLPVFGPLGLADRPAMLLGTNFLTGRRLGIDYAGSQVYLFD